MTIIWYVDGSSNIMPALHKKRAELDQRLHAWELANNSMGHAQATVLTVVATRSSCKRLVLL